MRQTTGLAIALVAFAAPFLLGATPQADASGPESTGIEAPAVNLFDIIHWDDATITTECLTGEMAQTDLQAAFTEARSIQTMPIPGCAEFRWHYRSPYPADHMHLRFGYDMNYRVLGQPALYPGTQTVMLDGEGPHTRSATFKQQEVSYDEHWGQADHGWVQDPGDDLPVHFKAGDKQEGDVVWRFDDIGNLTTTTLPIVPNPEGTGHMDVALRSAFLPRGRLFIENQEVFTWLPSHVEYSYFSYPDTRVEVRDVERDGRIHKETHFLVNITADVLANYWASTQVTMLPSTQFSRIILPDGTEVTRTNSFESTDWRNLAYETAQFQVLVNRPSHIQVTIPATLINQAGPGVYALVVEQPGLSLPAGDAKLSALFLVVLVAPALVALLALRNLRRLLGTMRGRHDVGGTPRAVLLVWFVGLLVAHAVVVLFVLSVGFARVASPQDDPMGLLVLFILLFIAAGHGLLAARGSDRVIRAMQNEIERQRRIEGELTASKRELELFASTAVHDLGAPLRGVAGFAGILERDHAKALDPAGRELLGRVVKGARRTQDLVRSLLDFAQAQEGRAPLETVDLAALVRTVVDSAQPQARAAGATITLGDLPTVRASPAGLQRVLQNLLENAIKFHDPARPPRIRIEARRQAGSLVVSVSDNGIGIAADDLSDIGKPFRRGKTSQRYEGSGLGLASATRIIEAAGGRLWVESTQGVGTTVHVALPSPPEAQGARTTGTSAPSA